MVDEVSATPLPNGSCPAGAHERLQRAGVGLALAEEVHARVGLQGVPEVHLAELSGPKLRELQAESIEVRAAA